MSSFSNELKELFIGRAMQIERREAGWTLLLGDEFQVSIGGYWRLRDASGILVTDLDDGHQFGLQRPVDAQATANSVLSDATITDTDFDPLTGDLKIFAGRGLIFEVLTISMGYETWQLYSAKGFEAAVGNGGLR